MPGFMQPAEAWWPVTQRLGERYPSNMLGLVSRTRAGLMGELGRRTPAGAVLVGYSMGGRLALHAALRHPGRLSALVIVGASAGIEDEAGRRTRRAVDRRLADWIESHPIEEVVARWEALPALAGQPPQLVAAQRPGRLRQDPRRLATLLREVGQGELEPVWDRLESLEMPVLAVAGERDELYARAAGRIADLVPRGAAQLIEGAGHAPHLEAPEAVAGALREFLDEHLGQHVGADADA